MSQGRTNDSNNKGLEIAYLKFCLVFTDLFLTKKFFFKYEVFVHAALWTHDSSQLCHHKSCQGCNLRWQNLAVVEFQVSFVDFPQQETNIKA